MSATTPEVDVDQLASVLATGARLVDVREVAEYIAGHVPGALSIPMGRLASRLGELDCTHTVHVVCASGNRSAAMADLLIGMGFDAVSVAGGTAAWRDSGRRVVTGAHPTNSEEA